MYVRTDERATERTKQTNKTNELISFFYLLYVLMFASWLNCIHSLLGCYASLSHCWSSAAQATTTAAAVSASMASNIQPLARNITRYIELCCKHTHTLTKIQCNSAVRSAMQHSMWPCCIRPRQHVIQHTRIWFMKGKCILSKWIASTASLVRSFVRSLGAAKN